MFESDSDVWNLWMICLGQVMPAIETLIYPILSHIKELEIQLDRDQDSFGEYDS